MLHFRLEYEAAVAQILKFRKKRVRDRAQIMVPSVRENAETSRLDCQRKDRRVLVLFVA